MYKGWGRKPSGRKAVLKSQELSKGFLLQEDGFIRSIGLGDSQSFSIVEDDVGIYYDATVPSKLENLLNNYDFKSDSDLLKKANTAIDLIKKYQISKYNHAPNIDDDYFSDTTNNKVLIIAQTKGDLSLEYGLAEQFNTNEIIDAATRENPNAKICLKVHPDVLNGRKDSDIDIESVKTKCKIISDDVNPISLLKHFSKVYTKTSQMGFEALIMGCECVCFGMPFYAGWGLTDDRVLCPRRKRKLTLEEVFAASYILYPKYHNPITQQPSDIIDTIKTIAKYKKIKTNEDAHGYVFGFSSWKKKFIKSYLSNFKNQNIHFLNSFNKFNLQGAKDIELDTHSEFFLWGNQNINFGEFPTQKKIKITRIEDGFIRSSGLGAELTEPISLVFDNVGMYFDCSRPSQLENIINSQSLTNQELKRANLLQDKITEFAITKYNIDTDSWDIQPTNKKIILVVGQVEGDASIQYGSPIVQTNIDLLRIVRSENKDAYIVYKPHPDELAGLRKKISKTKDIKKYCNEIINNVSVNTLFEKIDELHTMTSLMGFEALLWSVKVVCYGMPFYAGWGLTVDKLKCERRTKRITLDELVFASLISYPKYMHPIRKMFITPEEAVDYLIEEKKTGPKTRSLYRKLIHTIMVLLNFIRRK